MTNHSLRVAGRTARGVAFVAVAVCGVASASCGSSSEQPVPPPTPVSNLVVSGLTLDSAYAAVGSKVAVSVTVHNKGVGPSRASRTKVWLSNSFSTAPAVSSAALGTIATPVIDAGATYTGSVTITIPASAAQGVEYVWAVVDVDRTAAQTDVSDDSRAVPLTIHQTFAVATKKFTLTPLGTQVGDSSQFSEINDAGQIVGLSWTGTTRRNVLVHDGNVTDLGTCLPGDINDSGTIVCMDGSIWSNGTVTSFGFDTLNIQTNLAEFYSINDAGQAGGVAGGRPFIWSDGHLLRLAGSSDGGATQFEVPRNRTSPGIVVLTTGYHASTTGVRWMPDSTHAAVNCGAGAGFQDSGMFYAIGASDEYVGRNAAGAILCKNGVQTVLGSGAARDISRKGVVVGDLNGLGFILYPDLTLETIDDGLTTTGWTVLQCNLVNDNGQIIAIAKDNATGRLSQVLITQTP